MKNRYPLDVQPIPDSRKNESVKSEEHNSKNEQLISGSLNVLPAKAEEDKVPEFSKNPEENIISKQECWPGWTPEEEYDEKYDDDDHALSLDMEMNKGINQHCGETAAPMSHVEVKGGV